MPRLLAALLLLAACSSPSPEAPATTASPPPESAVVPPASPPPSTAAARAGDDASSDDVVLAHHGEIEACATTAHAASASLAGSVEVRWSVASGGAVSDVTLISSTLAAGTGEGGGEPARALERCIVAAVGGWTYPAIEATHVATVHHTFTIAAAPAAAPSAADRLGSGVSTGIPSEGPPPPCAVRNGEATVTGAGLSREVVRRVVRRHVNEIRFCYEQQLRAAPSLAGELTIHFTIDAAGETGTPSVARSALTRDGSADGGEPARQLEGCVTAAVDRWLFPAPEGGGTVTIDYPFEFDPHPPAPPALPSVGSTVGGSGEGTIGLGNLGTVGS